MQRVIIIHHLEDCWSSGYANHCTSFHEQAELVRQHLEENEYDLVILTRFEDHRIGIEHDEAELTEHIDTVHTYAYGWEKEMIEQGCFSDDQEWVDGGTHSEIVLIDNWMHELRGCKVDLCGAFDGECIEDMEIALAGAKVPFNRLNHLIV